MFLKLFTKITEEIKRRFRNVVVCYGKGVCPVLNIAMTMVYMYSQHYDEPQYDKTNKTTYALSEVSSQPGHSPSRPA